MSTVFRNIAAAHRGFWTKENRRSLFWGLGLLAMSLLMQVRTGRYASLKATNFVGDIILDNIPTVNMDFLIVQGVMLMLLLISVLFLLKPRYLLFAVKAIAFFYIARAISISLTHIGVYPDQAVFDTDDFGYRLYALFALRGNYFFSGHTGLPFLVGLILFEEKRWRYFFFSLSAIFAASVLLAHVHYSIDVFAAPFIAYGIFKITERLFWRDYAVMKGKADRVFDGAIAHPIQ